MDPIRTVICDDEPESREGIRDLLDRDADIAVVGEAGDGVEAVTVIESAAPELVFLDIQMPVLDGFGVIRALGAACCPVLVFVTAHTEYAIQAFEERALDYLVKPFTNARFDAALRRARDFVHQRRTGELSRRLAALFHDGAAPARVTGGDTEAAAGRRYLERIPVRVGYKVYFVATAEIDWIEADDCHAKLHVASHAWLLRETLNQLERELDPSRFCRVHRSAIVNLERIRVLQPYIGGAHLITLHDGTRIPLSRSRRARFESALGARL